MKRKYPKRERFTLTKLEQSTDPDEIVRVLRKGFLLSRKDVAAVTGASAWTVRQWDKGKHPSMAAEVRLTSLRIIALQLRETLTRKGVAQWLHWENPFLGMRALDALARGRIDRVFKAIREWEHSYDQDGR